MIKLENAGLRAPRKMSLGSGLHSQKRIRAPVSKMIGLRAPQRKFQGSRAPGTPPLGPCYFGLNSSAFEGIRECINVFFVLIPNRRRIRNGFNSEIFLLVL